LLAGANDRAATTAHTGTARVVGLILIVA
jgi:hypothetical protein